jgi:hypothetical protein
MRHAHRILIPFFTIAGAGCLTHPVATGEPTTKTNFTKELRQDAVDKVDLLFAIDNSASMGDKQDYLKAAVPDLITRLVTPNCVDASGKVVGVSHDDGVCDTGQAEFKPVHDLHIGIVSSALGPQLGEQVFKHTPNDYPGACDPNDKTTTGLNKHCDDQGHLLTRADDDEHTLTAAAAGFLAWFPTVKENQEGRPAPASPITSADDLKTDFKELVAGVHEQGDGLESQLESWYRFLIQPDPYEHLGRDGTDDQAKATWVGVDTTILAQRKAFLRPDSLVAVIVLSDENDSEIDATSLDGHGYWFNSANYVPSRGTSVCETNPLASACMSCSVDQAQGDSNCKNAGGLYPADSAHPNWGMDLNLRHVHMRQKYGVDPQYPIDRYVDGLSKPQIEDRTQSGKNCTNPLFAATLPDGSSTDPDTLCKLPSGPRTSDYVFYAHIGGVPHELLHFTPGDPKASELTDADWVKILGKDPERYDTSGIDPHMIESYKPRDTLAATSSANDADPISGREWITDQGHKDTSIDLEYACIFPLASPRDCSAKPTPPGCDCVDTGLTHDQTSPVCDPTTPTLQTMAKAYPTIRETLLAKKMGKQGIVSSICPIHVKEEEKGDPLYGYRPAVASIVDRLKSKLAAQCLPQKLGVQQDGTVKCLVLATLPQGGACDASLGMSAPDDLVVGPFRRTEHDAWVAAGKPGADPNTLTVCAVQQLVGSDLTNGSCRASSKPGWCYVEGDAAAADQCEQELEFTNGTPPSGVKVSLQCIEGP